MLREEITAAHLVHVLVLEALTASLNVWLALILGINIGRILGMAELLRNGFLI